MVKITIIHKHRSRCSATVSVKMREDYAENESTRYSTVQKCGVNRPVLQLL